MVDKKRQTVRTYAVGLICGFLLFTVNISQGLSQSSQIQWHSMEKAQMLAKKNGKKVLAYAVTSWCVYCKKMDKNVLPKQAVIDSLNTYFYPVKITLDSDEELVFNGKKITAKEFARDYNVRATPTTLFIDGQGNFMGRQPGYIPAEMFSRLLAFMGSEAFLKMDFKMYMQKYGKPADN